MAGPYAHCHLLGNEPWENEAGLTACWYDISRGKRLVQFDSHSSAGLRIGSSSADSPHDSGTHGVLSEPVEPGVPLQLYSLVQPLAQRLLEERYVFDATIRFVVEDYDGHQYGKTTENRDLRAWAEGRKGTVRVVPSWWRRMFGSEMGPQDPKAIARDTARDLSGLVGELAAL